MIPISKLILRFRMTTRDRIAELCLICQNSTNQSRERLNASATWFKESKGIRLSEPMARPPSGGLHAMRAGQLDLLVLRFLPLFAVPLPPPPPIRSLVLDLLLLTVVVFPVAPF